MSGTDRIELTDTSPMPFGNYKNQQMQDVPASYLHWLWTSRNMKADKFSPVAAYIRNNLTCLEKEYPDGIW